MTGMEAPQRPSFESLVRYEVVYFAGFNYWEPSFFYHDQRTHDPGRVYHTLVPDTDTNLVVIEVTRPSKNDFYFGTFRGLPPGDDHLTQEEHRRVVDGIMGMVDDAHIVEGTDLEGLIIAAVEEANPSLDFERFSSPKPL